MPGREQLRNDPIGCGFDSTLCAFYLSAYPATLRIMPRRDSRDRVEADLVPRVRMLTAGVIWIRGCSQPVRIYGGSNDDDRKGAHTLHRAMISQSAWWEEGPS